MAAEASKRLFSAELKMKQRLAGMPDVSPVGTGTIDTSGITNEDLMTAIKALSSEILMRAAKASEDERKKSGQEDTSGDETEKDDKLKEINLLKTEVRALSRSIHDTKREIKALGLNEEDQFTIVTSELDQIVAATERATETILNSAEKIDDLAQQLRQHSPDQFVTQLTDEMLENTIAMFEACNFQDLCGQRTTKVVNSLKFIEERVDRMLEIWGEENFDTIDHPDAVKAQVAGRLPEGEELHGPAEHGSGISQSDIDALFD